MKYLNSVENNYHEISFYLTTIRKIRYCLRILFWSQERVFHTLFVVVCYIETQVIGKSKWKKYLNINNGLHDFQIDPAISTINFSVALKWVGKSKRPGWKR